MWMIWRPNSQTVYMSSVTITTRQIFIRKIILKLLKDYTIDGYALGILSAKV